MAAGKTRCSTSYPHKTRPFFPFLLVLADISILFFSRHATFAVSHLGSRECSLIEALVDIFMLCRATTRRPKSVW
ncbi:hypothetical protein PILCRDRAFT_829081 [Piloderma croceum F 1598]|uniref:Uncharacterized protein n=1 Tax=Piloderma croceum (strain F 1598) TaxID=765440 RepID=A0A0C3AI61_PILCF|nr:hypothetical protein PILCRDRAFT_829081 [Piloderma croceum F 1598]